MSNNGGYRDGDSGSGYHRAPNDRAPPPSSYSRGSSYSDSNRERSDNRDIRDNRDYRDGRDGRGGRDHDYNRRVEPDLQRRNSSEANHWSGGSSRSCTSASIFSSLYIFIFY